MSCSRFKSWLFDGLLIIAGSVLMALSVDVFLDPNDVVPGGFTGLSMFANRLWGRPVGVTLLTLNIPFLLWAMKVLGPAFGPKTLLSVAVVGAAIDFLQPYVPVVRGEPLLYTAYGGLLYGLGQSLVFRGGGTSGGTEIPAKLLERFYGFPLPKSLLVMDVLILGGAACFFGLAPALYALIASWVMSRTVSVVEEGVNASLSVFIITGQPDPLREMILRRLGRGVTLLRGEGGYTGTQRTLLFTVINRRQIGSLRRIVGRADPQAFMVINASNEVLGEGFKPLPPVSLPRRS